MRVVRPRLCSAPLREGLRAALRPGNKDQLYSAVHPPSTTSDEPVISADASLARNTTAPIRSSTVPRRPSFIFASTLSLNAAFSKNGFVSGVSMKVGHSVLTRMPCGASSIAIALENPSIAHFDAQYSERVALATWPICEDMLMMEPEVAVAIIRRLTACAAKNAART